jgi:ubiquinone/menaquinone biosynthesis C-methylase UbiE
MTTTDTNTPPEQPRQGVTHTQVRASAKAQFDKWALSYDRSRLNELVFFPSIRMCMEEIARWQQARGGGSYNLLDVGCGTGRLISALSVDDNATELVGLDYSPVMVKNAAEKIGSSPFAENLAVVEGDAEHLPFEAERFDVITCCNSFHHYPHQAAVIQGFRRVLKPGGMLILIDGFRDNVIGWLIFDVGVVFVEKDVYHVPWREMKALIEGAGFATLRQRKMNVLAPLLVNVALR